MMKKIRKIILTEVHAEEIPKKKEKVEKEEKKVTPVYVKVLPDKELLIHDKAKLVFSVSQTSQDSPAHVDIRTHICNNEPKYVGPTQKGVNFDLEYLDEIIEMLQEISRECEKVGV
jgi:hypothetical protein